MYVRARLPLCNSLTARQWLWCLAVAAFVLRALIPNGYMPAAMAADRALPVALCNMMGGGSVTVMIDFFDDRAASQPDSETAGQECPFGVCGPMKLGPAPQPSSVLPSVAAKFIRVLEPRRATPRPMVAGPPLGSRAPPPTPVI